MKLDKFKEVLVTSFFVVVGVVMVIGLFLSVVLMVFGIPYGIGLFIEWVFGINDYHILAIILGTISLSIFVLKN